MSSSAAARPVRLVVPGGENHHCPLVELDVELETHRADGLEHDVLKRLARRHDDLAHGDRLDAAPAQRFDERGRRRLVEQTRSPASRREQDGPVLGHDALEDIEVRKGLR